MCNTKVKYLSDGLTAVYVGSSNIGSSHQFRNRLNT